MVPVLQGILSFFFPLVLFVLGLLCLLDHTGCSEDHIVCIKRSFLSTERCLSLHVVESERFTSSVGWNSMSVSLISVPQAPFTNLST